MATLHDYLRETAVLKSCRGLLNWDQETFMPSGAAELRAKQLSLLAGLVHRRQASDELKGLLERADAEVEAGSAAAAGLREVRRDLDRATKVPAALVEEQAHATTLARRAWVDAREKDDYAIFLPWLERIVSLSRRFAEALGYDDNPYDALLDLYETGFQAADLDALFSPLRDQVAALVGRILDSGATLDSSCLRREFPEARQKELARNVAAAFGFDFGRGRLDEAVHPFCGGAGPWDVRITTRWNDRYLADGLFSVLHEVGHGIYEQGLPSEHFGGPLGEACSLGIHESQSRLWENLVGRSRGFVAWVHPQAQAAFPDALGDVDADGFHRAINEVKPSLIRVDADEVTYNLHIFLRFELEQALLTGALEAKDLPDAWNDGFERLFRLRPPDDRHGCLQDIHWSAGLYGYFPTYTLGNVYAAQIFDKAEEELGDLEAQFARGEFQPLRTWLADHVHAHGRRFLPRELVERITGAPPSPGPLVRRLEEKYGTLYGV